MEKSTLRAKSHGLFIKKDKPMQNKAFQPRTCLRKACNQGVKWYNGNKFCCIFPACEKWNGNPNGWCKNRAETRSNGKKA